MDYFHQLKVEVDVVRSNEPLEKIFEKEYQAVVLSPGPERPENSKNLLPVAEHYLGKLPLLGICLGHQALGMLGKAPLVKAEKPMHGKVSRVRVHSSVLFKDLPTHFDVVRYHSLILENCPKGYDITAKTDQGEIMAIEDEELMAHGIQFHPEAILTQYGLDILRNWSSFYNIV